MLMDANTKLWMPKTSEIFHFFDILHKYTHVWKYASFEGVEIVGSPWFYGDLGLKKASQKDAIFRNSRKKKGQI